MTRLTMTEHEQRVALARWMGDSCQSCQQPLSDEMLPDTCSCKVPQVPDYTRDLNAAYEAETRLLAKYRHASYLEALCDVCRPDGAEPESIDDLVNAVRATSAQRAEALLRTLGLWKEKVP